MSRESSPTTGQGLPFSDAAKIPSPSATAESHAAELGRLNEEIRRVATRATRLLEVTTALSEAQSVEDVTAVVLNMGLAVVEATRGVLVSVEPDRLRLLGTRGIGSRLESQLALLNYDTEVPVVHALKRGEVVWIESGEEFREKYGSVYQGFEELRRHAGLRRGAPRPCG